MDRIGQDDMTIFFVQCRGPPRFLRERKGDVDRSTDHRNSKIQSRWSDTIICEFLNFKISNYRSKVIFYVTTSDRPSVKLSTS